MSESTKREDEIVHHEIEMQDLHLDIPHIQGERINELCESTKCEVDISQQDNSKISDPPPWEISSPPNEKRGTFNN